MKRKMIGAAAAYMSGLFFASFFTSGGGTAAALLIIAAVFFLSLRFIPLTKKDVIMVTAVFAAGFFIFTGYTKIVYDKAAELDGTNGSFEGEVVSAELLDRDYGSYILDGETDDGRHIKLSYFGEACDVRAGDRMVLNGCKFSLPESDYLFDSRDYYRADGIYLTAEDAGSVSFERTGKRPIKNLLLEYKEKISSRFLTFLGKERGGFLCGMVFGDSSHLDASTKTSVYRCGIGHVLAVSGLHVSILSVLLMMLLGKLPLGRTVPVVILNVFLILLIIMAGAPESAIRAAVMIDFIYAAKLFRRQSDTFNSLACAVLMICIADPYAIYSRGFLLSLSGTFGIGVFAPYMTKKLSDVTFTEKLIKRTVSMLCTTLAVMPLSMLYFDEVSVISPITNILLIPLCTGAMICGMLYVLTGGLISVLSVAGLLTDIVFAVTEWLSQLSITYISCGSRRLFAIAALCAGFTALVQLIFRNRRFTAIALTGASVSFMLGISIYGAVRRNTFKAAVVGNGANAAVVVTYKNRADVIDLSGHYKSAEYVSKYLSRSGISDVTMLVLTENAHSQHSSYLKELELSEIGKIMMCTDEQIADMYPKEPVYLPESGFTAENNAYRLTYSDRKLTLEYNGTEINFVSSKNYSHTEDEFDIVYGNIVKSTEHITDGTAVYTDGFDDEKSRYDGYSNTEILIEKKGRIKLRRL